MKKSLLPLALLCLVTAGCNTDITFTIPAAPNTPSPVSPTTANAAQGRKDTVTFINNDDRLHVIVVGPAAAVAAWPAGISPTPPTLPPAPTAAIPNPPPDPRFAACASARILPGQTYVWTVPATLSPPVTLSWKCAAHTGESGTITIAP